MYWKIMNWYPSMIAHVKDITRSMSVELLEVELQSGGDLHSAFQAMSYSLEGICIQLFKQ